jgi:DNA-binding ferritin-like protein
MNGLKFIHTVKELFGISMPEEESTKKKTIKELLQKLKLRRITLKKELKEESDLIKREAIHDSIKIIKKQIKKGKEILDE